MSRRSREEAATVMSVLMAANEPMRPGEVIAESGLGRKTVIKTLRSLQSIGNVEAVPSVKGTRYQPS